MILGKQIFTDSKNSTAASDSENFFSKKDDPCLTEVLHNEWNNEQLHYFETVHYLQLTVVADCRQS